MRVVEAGHVYHMRNVDGGGEQLVSFVRRRDDDGRLLGEARAGVKIIDIFGNDTTKLAEVRIK